MAGEWDVPGMIEGLGAAGLIGLLGIAVAVTIGKNEPFGHSGYEWTLVLIAIAIVAAYFGIWGFKAED